MVDNLLSHQQKACLAFRKNAAPLLDDTAIDRLLPTNTVGQPANSLLQTVHENREVLTLLKNGTYGSFTYNAQFSENDTLWLLVVSPLVSGAS